MEPKQITDQAPCPWCREQPWFVALDYGKRWEVACRNDKCPVQPSTDPYYFKQEALDNWNSYTAKENEG